MMRKNIGKNGLLHMEDLKKNDLFAIAYYLYCAVESYEDKGIPREFIELFFKLVEQLHKTSDILIFLESKVAEAEEKGMLTPIKQEEDAGTSGKVTTEKENFAFNDNTLHEGIWSRNRSVYRPSASKTSCKYLEDRDINRLLYNGIHEDQVVLNLYRCFFSIEDNKSFFQRIIANFLLRKIPDPSFSLLDKLPEHLNKILSDRSKVSFITEAIDLSEDEADLLVLSYRCSVISYYLTQLLSVEWFRSNFYMKALNINKRRYDIMLRGNSKLRSFGFIDGQGFLYDTALEAIYYQNLGVFFEDLVKEADCKNYYKISSFNVNKDACNIMQKMLGGSENISILLYGKPGSGKTEFAKSLAVSSKLKPMLFKNEVEIERGRSGNVPVLCRLNLLLSIKNTDTVLIVDEADTILKTKEINFFGMAEPSEAKGTVNKMLENSKNKIIWIVNFTNQIDDSTLRRFNFSYRFDSMSREQLRSITRSKLLSLDLSQKIKKEILDVMEKYNVTGSSVDNVVKTIKSLEPKNKNYSSDESIINYIKAILNENELLINGKSKMREYVNKSYDIHAINASMEPDKIVRMIENAQSFMNESEKGIRMLFYGVSGTGKTEFVRYIAEKLGKKILLKRASDILDMYVGGSEKNIRDAFEEAERTGSILLFDEADSFFADRTKSQHSWERTQVNEFLTQMEEFPGILVCTTNLKQIMDKAMNRRFHMIVEFKSLSKNGILCMLKRYFPVYKFSDADVERIERRTSVTPGDFGTLVGRIRFMDKKEVDKAYIVNELCKMQEEKKNCTADFYGKIGFTA